MSKFDTAKKIFNFFMAKKQFWLIPVLVLLLLIGVLIVFLQTSALAPLIYPFI